VRRFDRLDLRCRIEPQDAQQLGTGHAPALARRQLRLLPLGQLCVNAH